MTLGIIVLAILLAAALTGFERTPDTKTYISLIERDEQGRAIKDGVTGQYKMRRVESGKNPRTPKPFSWLDS